MTNDQTADLFGNWKIEHFFGNWKLKIGNSAKASIASCGDGVGG